MHSPRRLSCRCVRGIDQLGFFRRPVATVPQRASDRVSETVARALCQDSNTTLGATESASTGVTVASPQQRLLRSKKLGDVLAVVLDGEVDPSKWPAVSLATAWHRLALKTKARGRSLGSDKGSVEKAVDVLKVAHRGRCASEFNVKQHSKVLYSWATLRVREPRLILAACAQLSKELDELKGQAFSNTLYALALLDFKNDEFVRAACEHSRSFLFDLNGQGLANVIYALGRLEVRHDAFLSAFCTHVPDQLPTFTPQGLTNSVQALCQLRFSDADFLESFCKHAVHRVPEFRARDLSSAVYALGVLQCTDAVFLRAACTEATGRLSEFNGQDLANAVYALGLAGVRNDAIMLAVCKCMPGRVKSLTALDITNIGFAYASLYGSEFPIAFRKLGITKS